MLQSLLGQCRDKTAMRLIHSKNSSRADDDRQAIKVVGNPIIFHSNSDITVVSRKSTFQTYLEIKNTHYHIPSHSTPIPFRTENLNEVAYTIQYKYRSSISFRSAPSHVPEPNPQLPTRNTIRNTPLSITIQPLHPSKSPPSQRLFS
jgi:hypothetical protein